MRGSGKTEIAPSALTMWLTADFVRSGLETYAKVVKAVYMQLGQIIVPSAPLCGEGVVDDSSGVQIQTMDLSS